MSRRPPKPAPVVVKRPADQRRKLPPELEAFARSDDEKLRIRRPRVDQGRVRDPREGYTVAGVSNRDARAVYDVRTEAMRSLWAGGEADDEALSALGQLFHEALRLELWHARRLTSFAALAEEVVGVPAAKAEALAEAYAEQSGEPLSALTERATALWLRTEAGLYEGDENARARIVSRSGTLMLELSVELAHVSTALAGVGARHLPLARSPREEGDERRQELRERAHDRRGRDEERSRGEQPDERRQDRPRDDYRDEPRRHEPRRNESAMRAVAVLSAAAKGDQRELDELLQSSLEPAYRASFDDGALDDADDRREADSGVEEGASRGDTLIDELVEDGARSDAEGADDADQSADDTAGVAHDAARASAGEQEASAHGLGGTRLLTRKSRLDAPAARNDRDAVQRGLEGHGLRIGRAGSDGDRPRLQGGEQRSGTRDRAEPRGGEKHGAERRGPGGLDRSALERPARDGRDERTRFGERGSNAERARPGSDRPRFAGKERGANADKERFAGERGGKRDERPRFAVDRGAFGARFGAGRDGNRDERPRFAGDRSSGARFGADRGNRDDRSRFAPAGNRSGGGNERPRFGHDKHRNAAGEDRPRFGNDRGRAPGPREERPRFGNDRGRSAERPKQGGFADRGRGAAQGKFGGKAKPGDKGGKGFGARKPFGQQDKLVEGPKAREPRRADDDDNLE